MSNLDLSSMSSVWHTVTSLIPRQGTRPTRPFKTSTSRDLKPNSSTQVRIHTTQRRITYMPQSPRLKSFSSRQLGLFKHAMIKGQAFCWYNGDSYRVEKMHKMPLIDLLSASYRPLIYRVVPGGRNHCFWPSQRVSKHTLMKSETQPASVVSINH